MDNEDVSILVTDNDSETRLQNGDAEFSNTDDDQNDANDYQNFNGEDKDEMIMMTDMNGQSTVPTPGQKDNNSDNISLNHTSDDFLVSAQEDPSGTFPQSPGIARKMEAAYIDDHTRMVFSSDPSKRIDYILVLPKEPQKDPVEQEHHKHMRTEFEKNLEDFGMELEIIERDASSDGHEYVQVHCPFDVLARGASVIKLRKPVINKKLVFGSSKGCLSCCKLKSDVLSGDEDSYQLTEPFDVKHEKRFVESEDRDGLFTSAERSLITHDLLERIQFKDSNKFEDSNKARIHQGVECLIQHGVYVAAFPLHDHLKAKEVMAKEYNDLSNDRERLYHGWAHPKNIFHFQPLPLVRKYFGEQLAFYFAWIGWYTFLLFPAALAGLAVFIYGLATFATRDIPVRDVCNPDAAPGNYILCPKCDLLCNYTRLSDTCPYAKFTRIFDNQATLALAIFMSFWAICFLEIWRRTQTNLQFQWNVADFDQDEHFRPEFVIKVKTRKKNPVSNTEDPHVPAKKKLVLRCASISVILFMASVVIVTIFAVLVYRVAVVWAIYQVEYAEIKSHAQIITTVTSAVINVIAILILGLIYERLAKALTDFEDHKTQTSYNDSYTFKMIVFQFINFYGSIIYIAFFKGSFVDRPGLTRLYMFNRFKQDQCDESGCFAELTIQLIIIMVGKQIIGGILEMFIPLLKRCWRERDNKKALNMRWEQDFDLEVLPKIPVFDEYLEMVIQYGFVVLFVAAFPLAPLCALLNNMIEVRLDAYKLLTLFRRQPAYRAQDIGAWQSIITIFTYLAVVTNAFIIAWTSEFIPKQVYKFTHDTFDLTGYMDWSLVAFNTSEFQPNQRPDPTKFPESVNITECRYRPFGLPSSEVSSDYEAYFWHILCARWAFVIVFEHTCFLLMNMAWVIPSVSKRVKMIKQYEKKICTESNVDDLFEKVREKRIKMMNTMNTLSGTAFTGNSNLSSRLPI